MDHWGVESRTPCVPRSMWNQYSTSFNPDTPTTATFAIVTV